MKTSQKTKQYKYEKIVTHLSYAIENGVIKGGSKLPSLRKTASQFNCAISVALQAYQELEVNNLIRGIEKSGYYAMPKQQVHLPKPEQYNHTLNPTKSKPHSMTNKLIEIGSDPKFIPFGCAIPSEAILPIAKLKKHLQYQAKNRPELLTSYTTGLGIGRLRQEIAKLMIGKGVQVSMDDILITNGCTEALALAIKAVSKPGETIAIESPGFFGFSPILKQLDRHIIEIPCSATDGLNLDLFEKQLGTAKVSACIVSASIQNPLGFVMSEELKKRLIALAKKFDFAIIEDDIYGECRFDNKIQPPIKAIDSYRKALYCSSFSKTVSPGMRIGWLIAGEYHNLCEQIKFSESLGGPAILQHAMADFLQEGGYSFHMRMFKKRIAEQTYQMKSLLVKHLPKNIKITQPDGGFFLWLELDNSIDSMQLFEKALQAGIGIVPGPIFSCNPDVFHNCIRISCAFPVTDRLERGVKQLGSIISDLT